MPFASAKQARFLASQHPDVFKKFVKDSGGKVKIMKRKKRAQKSGNKFTEALA